MCVFVLVSFYPIRVANNDGLGHFATVFADEDSILFASRTVFRNQTLTKPNILVLCVHVLTDRHPGALSRQRAGSDQASAGNLAEGLPRGFVGFGVLDGVACTEVRAHHAYGRSRGVPYLHRQREGGNSLTRATIGVLSHFLA